MTAIFVGSVALIAYTFAGYPAIMALRARALRRPPHRDRGHLPSVSMIIVAYNEADVIEQKLANTAALDFPADRLEVIVVTDGSTDETPTRVGRTPGIRVLHEPERRGKLAAMNRAAGFAQGEVLVFSDANNRYSRTALRELVAPLADPRVGIVTGRKAIDDGSGRPLDRAEALYWRYEDKLKVWESETGSVVGVAGEILAFRREAFFSPRRGTMTEDFVQAMLAATNGWRVVYAPEALSLEAASATLGDEATRRSRLVTGRWQALAALLPAMLVRRPGLAWRVISHKGLRPLVPAALALAALSNAMLVPATTWARATMAAQLAFYAAAGLGWRDACRGRRRVVTFLPYYFSRMNLATIAGLRDFACGRREAVWARVQRG